MPQPRFQTTGSSVFGAPGVYIQQLAVSAPVRGLFNGVTGFVGRCVRGPVGVPTYCQTYQRFLDVFACGQPAIGARDYGINGGAVVGDVWWALQGKLWGNFWVVRTAAAAAAVASFEVNSAAAHAGTNIANVAASSPGLWGNSVKISVQAASDGNANHWNLVVQLYGKTITFPNIDTFGGDDNTAIVVGTDPATWIAVTKLAGGRPINNAASTDGADANGFVSLGQTVSGYTSVAGADGSIADTDYTVTGGPMDVLHGQRGIDSKLVVGRSNTAIKTKIFGLAPTANLSGWLICPDNSTVLVSTWTTELGSYRDRHVWPAFNHPVLVDPVTGANVVGEPHVQEAAVLSQIEPDVHPGVSDTAPLNQGVVSLSFTLLDGDKDLLDESGSSFLTYDQDQNGNNVILFGNGRTADLTPGNDQVDGERQKSYLIAGLANRARGDQFRPNTPITRAKRKAAFGAWLTELAKSGRFVQVDDSGNPQYQVLNDSEVNSQSDQDAGIQRDFVAMQLISKNIWLQLQVQIATDVTISQVSSSPVTVTP